MPELTSGSAGRERAEGELRRAIVGGDMAPGHRLVEGELSEMYGVTRGSARLALDAMVAEGLVERVPNHSARVRSVSTDEAVAIMECRMVLDGLLCRKAAESPTDAQIARLHDHRDTMRAAVAQGDLLTYSDLIQRHHRLVQEMAGQPVASGLVERLQAQIVRFQFQLSLRPGRAQKSLPELERVVDAIAARDPARAEAAAQDHIREVIAAVITEASRT